MAQSIRIYTRRKGLAALRRNGFKIFQSNEENELNEENTRIREEIFESQMEEANARRRKA